MAPRDPGMTLRTLLGALIKELGARPLRALGRRAKVSPSTISNWLDGAAWPQVDKLDRVAHALRVPTWMFLVPGCEDLNERDRKRLGNVVRHYIESDEGGRAMIAAQAAREAGHRLDLIP